MREQDGLFLVMPALLLLERTLRARGERVALERDSLRGLVMAGAALLAFVPQLLAYRSLYGGFHPSPIVRQKMHYWSPHFFDVLFDPAHSLFFWSPVLLVAAAGPRLGGGSQGAAVRPRPRRPPAPGLDLRIHPELEPERRFRHAAVHLRAPPASPWAWPLWPRRRVDRGARRGSVAAVAFFAWWNVSLMVQFGLKLMDRQKLEWPKVAVQQVTEVPKRLGRAAFLFFTDRERLVREGVS